MGLEKFIEKPRKYKPITFANRFKSYLQDNISNQQRIRNFANAYPQQPKPRTHVDKTPVLPLYTKPSLAFRPAQHITDAEGLGIAKDQEKRIYVHGNTMYLSGTSWRNQKTGMPSLQDPIDDLKIPIYKTRYTQRYKDAEEFMKQNPNIDRIVGHSLGGAVALELGDKHKIETRTYMAPVVDTGLFNNGVQPERYKNDNDPISMFDLGAKSYERKPDPSSRVAGKLTAIVGTALTGEQESSQMAGGMVESFLNAWTAHTDYKNIPEANNRLSTKYTM